MAHRCTGCQADQGGMPATATMGGAAAVGTRVPSGRRRRRLLGGGRHDNGAPALGGSGQRHRQRVALPCAPGRPQAAKWQWCSGKRNGGLGGSHGKSETAAAAAAAWECRLASREAGGGKRLPKMPAAPQSAPQVLWA